MSNTPETDEAVKASNGQWSFVLKETCQRLERERNKAVEDATNYYAKIGELERERDEAREDATNYYARIGELERERDEARNLVDHYREQKDLLPISWDV